MKSVEELLKNLARPEVLEFGLVTNRLPSVNIGGKFEPVDDEAPSTEQLLQMLAAIGGSRHVDNLSEKPIQWTSRLEGVGVIAVAAIMRKDVVQARLTVARRDGARSGSSGATGGSAGASASASASASSASAAASTTASSTSPAAVSQSAPTPRSPQANPPPEAVRPDAPAAAQAAAPPAARPSSPFAKTLPSTGNDARPSPLADAVIRTAPPSSGRVAVPTTTGLPPSLNAQVTVGPSAAPPAVTPSRPVASPTAPVVKKKSAWDDDDDEPTVQTSSPPVTNPNRPSTASPAAKPAPPAAGRAPSGAGPAASTLPLGNAAAAAAREQAMRAPVAKPSAPSQPVAPKSVTSAESGTHPAVTVAINAAAESDAKPGPVVRRSVTPTSVDAVDVAITHVDKGSGGAAAAAPVAAPAPAPTPAPDALGTSSLLAPSRPPTVGSAPARPMSSPSIGPGQETSGLSLDAFLAMATADRARDLHVIGGRPLLLRIGAELTPRTAPVPAAHVERIVREIVPARLRDTLETNGACDFAVEHPEHGRFRVNVSRHRTGFKMSMRVVPREPPTLASLGLPDTLAESVTHRRGLVLVTGASGHGKTTTVAALVNTVNRESPHHVVVLEDPIEFVHPGKRACISHREVGLHARSFSRAVAAALREDPDVIVIGEIRDLETARAAVTAVESGPLVVATMNAVSADGAVTRLVQLFPPSERARVRTTLLTRIRLVIHQQLRASGDGTRLVADVSVTPGATIRGGDRFAATLPLTGGAR